MNAPATISLKELTKHYGRVLGVERFSLEVAAGEVFGLLGPNGAGKTTCLRLILGLLRPDRGAIEIFGRPLQEDSWRFKERVGNLPGDVDWWPDLRGREILEFFARFRPGCRVTIQRMLPELLEKFQLDDRLLRRRMRTYSRGMRRKLGLVAALQHDPDLLILDEPTSGLDPILRRAFFDWIRACKERGKTVLLSSHNLLETEGICDRVGIVRRGRLAAVETMDSLRAKSYRRVSLAFPTESDALRFHLEGAQLESVAGAKVTFRYGGPVPTLLKALGELVVEDVTIAPPSLADFFLQHYQGNDHLEREGGGP